METVEKQDRINYQENIRLNKYLAACGVASRRKADELIQQGRVAINNKVVTILGTVVKVGRDKVVVDGNLTKLPEKFTYILLNKPKDYITTASDERGRRIVLDLIPRKERLFPVGRLDRNSTGVLILTNDGELAHRLMHARFGVMKTYQVKLNKPLQSTDKQKLLEGVYVEGDKVSAIDVAILERTKKQGVLIAIHEGKNRQVRKMFGILGYVVKALDRIEYGGITTKGLNRGEWRYLGKREVDRLRSITKLNNN